MDIVKLIDLFKATLQPKDVDAATNELEKIQKIATFLPTLLQIVTDNAIEIAVRQAAVVFFKNSVARFWEKQETSDGQISEYSIHKMDKETLKCSIIDAMALTQDDRIRSSLAHAIRTMMKYDYPMDWPHLVKQITSNLTTSDPNRVYGGLLALLQLIKNYEYKTNTEKVPLVEEMKTVCPILYEMMAKLLADDSQQSMHMQKIILKTFYTFIQYSLPLSLFTNNFFTLWMEIFRQIIERPLSETVLAEARKLDESDRKQLPAFKTKKWALHIVVRVFERFGKPKLVASEYKTFAKWYLETFSSGIIQVILKTLAHSIEVNYPNRIIQQCINYLNYSIPHNQCWKILKQNVPQLMASVIFPLLCHDDEDDELWQDDPQEYVRRKFDLFEESISKMSAAQAFLVSVCKRPGMLKSTISYAVQVLSHGDSSARQRDGALKMLGAISEQMLKKEEYRKQASEMLVNLVFPYFTCDAPFLRARAAWVLQFFDDYEFNNEEVLVQATNCLQQALIGQNDLPVKVQAAISLNTLIFSQPKAKQLVEQNLRAVVLSYLDIVKISQNDDVISSLQKMFMTYDEQIIPISQEIITGLVMSLDLQNSMSTGSILTAIDTVLMMIEAKEVLQAVEPFVIEALATIFQKTLFEFYEEANNIVTTLTSKSISPEMWKIFEMIYKLIVAGDKGNDYFTELMPALHNFVTVDPDAFLADRARIVAMLEICKFVLDYPHIEDVHENVLKIVEVIMLQYRDKIREFMPAFIELIVQRFMKEIKTEDLNLMCLDALIAAFYIDPQFFFATLTSLQERYPSKSLIGHFIKEWLENVNTFCGVHDRKVCLLGLSKLLVLDSIKNCMEFLEKTPTLMSNVLKLFESLKEAYKLKASAENEESDEESYYDTDSDEEEIEDDDDHGDDKAGAQIEERIKKGLNTAVREMDEDEFDTTDSETDLSELDDDYQNEMTSLESYETSLDLEDSTEDEYIAFRCAVETIQTNDQQWYEALFGRLNEIEANILKDIFVLAQQRKDAHESRKIERGGGYTFNPTVPINFNFGGSFFAPQQQQQQQQQQMQPR